MIDKRGAIGLRCCSRGHRERGHNEKKRQRLFTNYDFTALHALSGAFIPSAPTTSGCPLSICVYDFEHYTQALCLTLQILTRNKSPIRRGANKKKH